MSQQTLTPTEVIVYKDFIYLFSVRWRKIGEWREGRCDRKFKQNNQSTYIMETSDKYVE